MTKTIPEKSTDTLTIEACLRELAIGEVVTYDQLSEKLGRDVRQHCTGNLQTARRTVLKEDKIITEVVRGEGIKRIDDATCVSTAPTVFKRMRGLANRQSDRLKAVEFNALDEESKRKHLVVSAQLGAIHLMSTSNSTKKIEAKVEGNSQATIPVGKVLELFK